MSVHSIPFFEPFLLTFHRFPNNHPKSMAFATMPLLLLLLLRILLLQSIQGAAASSTHLSLLLQDRITLLPGQPPVSFRQYSGYVTVDARKQRSLFYYLAEAESDPGSKPLVLWLNGGPGCSSLGVGAFSENGPFRPSGDALVRNECSWNREANMLYLEAPIGVGFSYSTDASSYESVNDRITARDNLVFLKRWLVKFPQYRNRSLYITGESYAGHYVPQLAELMLQYNSKRELLFNLRGIALGNPVLDFATDFNSRAEYFWSHGLISDSTYNMFTSVCNYSRYASEYARGSISPICSTVMRQVNKETSKFVDNYDVTLDVCIPSVVSQTERLSLQRATDNVDVCVEDETVNYLNRRDVQNALHARLVGVLRWVVCSDVLDYDMTNLEIPTIAILGKLIKARVPVLVYSGDQDSVIPLTGSRKLIHSLAKELGLNATTPYHVWFEGQQVGGWTQVYGEGLTYATIRGASHEAPFSQPERSLVLFRSFLEGSPLPKAF